METAAPNFRTTCVLRRPTRIFIISHQFFPKSTVGSFCSMANNLDVAVWSFSADLWVFPQLPDAFFLRPRFGGEWATVGSNKRQSCRDMINIWPPPTTDPYEH